jgi:hypothetical protein
MKTKHLFTLCVLLSLTSSGMLLTEVSSIAQVKQNGARETTEPEASEKNTGNEVKGTEASSNDSSPLPLIFGGLSGLLHLLGTAGLVWAYFKINQLIEKSRDSRSQIKSLIDRLNASEQKQKVQGDQLKTIASEAINAHKLTSGINSIKQSSQQKNSDVGYANPTYSLPISGSTNTAVNPAQTEFETTDSMDNLSYLIPKFQGIDVGISLPRYPFLDTYQQSPDSFKNQYMPKVVSEDIDNLQKRRSGDSREIILGEDRQGNYWLFKDCTTTYLIPSPKLKVNDLNMRTAGGLFDCNNYIPGYKRMTVVCPAILSVQQGGNERWKLEQKGALEFT